jgi:mannose-6-phosphate isomerase-like protein (cupin superfamily)
MESFYVNLEDLPVYEADTPHERRMRVVFDDPASNLPFSVGQFILKPGQNGPPHKHEKEIEIYIVLSGEGKITFDNKKTYRLTPDHMLYVPPKILHETVNTGATDLVFYGVFVAPVDLNGMATTWNKVS